MTDKMKEAIILEAKIKLMQADLEKLKKAIIEEEEAKKHTYHFSGKWYYDIFAKTKEEAIEVFENEIYADDIEVDVDNYDISED